MLLDFGWSELLLIGIVALVFIGPKDLPKAMRVAGYWIRKARNLSAELQSGIDQMIREAELDDIRQDLKKVGEFDFDREFRNTIDADGSLAESLKPPELPDFSEPAPVPLAVEATNPAEILPPDTYLPEPEMAPLVPAELVHHEVAAPEPETYLPEPAAGAPRPETIAAPDPPPAAVSPVKA